MRNLTLAFTTIFLIAATLPAAATAAEGDSNLDLVLRGALHRGDPEEGRYDLYTECFRRSGQWGFVYGTALNFDNGEHLGRVESLTIDGDRFRADLRMRIMGDPWTKGGRARIGVVADRTDGDRFEGTYTCVFNGVTTKGKAELTCGPPPAAPEGYKPITHDERPRMLFRAHELDALKKKLDTPFGKAALVRMKGAGDPITLGLMYQLTGDKQYADRAWKAVVKTKSDYSPGPFQTGQVWGPRMTKVAVTYDLCYDAWDEARHNEIAAYYRQMVPRLLWKLKSITTKANWHPCSNYSGPMRGAGSMAALSVWGIQSDRPAKPEKPQTQKTVDPAADYEPGKGVPVHDFTSGEMPDEWIFVGGYKPLPDEQALDVAAARPEVGEKVTFGDRTDTWRAIPHAKDQGYWTSENMMGGKPMIDITNAIDRIYNSTSYFYTVIRNDKPRWVRIEATYPAATFYLAGKKIEHGGYAKIDKGLYPLLVVAPIGTTEPWGRHLMQPKLIETTEAKGNEYLDRRMGEYKLDIADWEYACKVWESRGKMNVEYLQWHHIGRRHMMRYYRQGLGTGGFQPETGHYAMISVRTPMLYASVFNSMFGRPVTPQQDVELYCARKLMPMIFTGDGEVVVQDINGDAHLHVDHVQRGYPITPDRYQPALHWYWNYITGADKDPAKALERLTAFAFVRYPADAEPKPPAEVMPLNWEAETFGFYSFRNAWKGPEDVVLQVFAKAHPIGGWNHPNAGTIRLHGLGHTWVTGPASRGADRWQEPVVDLPMDTIHESACGVVTHRELEREGSGSVTIDLGDLYSRESGKVRPQMYDRHGVRHPEGRGDTGISGLRAVAVDYSGRSGAPALLALVDRVDGAKTTRWMWQLPKSDELKVEIGERSFTLDYGDATLVATFVTPADVKLDLARGKREYIIKGGSKGGQKVTREVNAVHATGSGGDYFVVVTIQPKDAPAVKISGKGLDATATVGGQRIRFDGKKIIIGK